MRFGGEVSGFRRRREAQWALGEREVAARGEILDCGMGRTYLVCTCAVRMRGRVLVASCGCLRMVRGYGGSGSTDVSRAGEAGDGAGDGLGEGLAVRRWSSQSFGRRGRISCQDGVVSVPGSAFCRRKVRVVIVRLGRGCRAVLRCGLSLGRCHWAP